MIWVIAYGVETPQLLCLTVAISCWLLTSADLGLMIRTMLERK
eukprot:UN08268